ncbi:MAG: hypothetical protein HFE77_06050 [Clostridiales bacterium]|nr:hypothetical protein [Clostridiales bacterium]
MLLKERMAKEEQLVLSLSSLYEQYSYEKYSMAKFEEYSFYSDNRKFMPGEGMIAFNSSDGKLMALKPDITLSIVKNAKMSKESQTKLYYNESVFRISDETHDYREIKQTGVEVLGDIDPYAQAELFFLALLSLREIDEDFVLSVSHMGIVAHFVNALALPVEIKKQMIRCFAKKSVHELKSLCQQNGLEASVCERLIGMLSLNGKLSDVLPKLRALCGDDEMTAAVRELEALYQEIKDHPLADKVIFDASVVNHIDYYNGLIFKGYVKGAPGPVLSGGRYDKLACRIRENACAIGFAVYLDGLNYYYPNQREKTVDALILCEGSTEGLLTQVNVLVEQGLCVRIEKDQTGIEADTVYRYEDGKLSRISC